MVGEDDPPEKANMPFLSWGMAPFLTLFTGQAFSLLGSRLVNFSLIWWLTESTGSASVLATATIMFTLPQVFIGPFAGALVDRWKRKTVLMVSDSLVALAVVLLAFLYSQGAVEVWHIFALMMIRAAGGAFQWPAMQASTTMMVPEEHLSRVSGLNQALSGTASILAPPLGALLLELLPIQWVLSLDVVTAVLAVGPLFLINVPQPDREFSEAQTVVEDMKEGLRFVWGWSSLRTVIGASVLINLVVNPAFSLLPLLVTNYFEGGAAQLAWLQSANGVGMILGGLALGAIGVSKKRMTFAFMGLAVAGACIAVVSQVPPRLLLVAVAAFFVFGFTNSMANRTIIALLQAVVPPDKQGRVFTLLLSLSVAISPLGLAVAGPVSEMLGVRFWFLFSGVAMLAICLYAFMSPDVRKLDEMDTSD